MHINENEIPRLFNQRNWAVALNYQRKGIIETLNIEQDTKHQRYEIQADTNTFGYHNHVHISLSEDGIVLQYECECPYCNDEVACGHVGAVLLFLHDLSPASFPYHFDLQTQREDTMMRWMKQQQLQKTKQFLDTYKRLSEGEFQANLMSEKVRLLATLEDGYGGLTFGYKIGIDKFYIIKNIVQFLSLIEQKETHSYGKNLSFAHHLDAFDDVSKETIAFLQTYQKTHTSELEFGYYDKRNLLLDEKALDDFFNFYSEEGSSSINCRFSLDELETIPLHIKKDTSDYIITTPLTFDTLYKGKQYWYQYVDGCFSRFSQQISETCTPLLIQLQQDRQLIIPQEEMKDFCAYVYESIKQEVTLSGDSIDSFLFDVEQISCYIDVEDHGELSIRATYVTSGAGTLPLFTNKKEVCLQLHRVESLIKTYADIIDEDQNVAYITVDLQQVRFLKEGLAYLDKVADVFVSDAVSQISAPKKVNFQIGIRMENNLLEVDVSSVDVPAQELYAVLKSYRKKKKYHRLTSGQLLYLEQDAVQELNEMMEELHVHAQDLVNGTLELPSYHSFELDDMANHASSIVFDRSASFTHALQHMTQLQNNSFEIPEAYQSILRDYQVIGYQWIKTMCAYGFGGILADDMGLGKTLQMIAVLEDEQRLHPEQVSLIVTPASLILNWEDELSKFSSHLDCLCIHGSTAQRQLQIKEILDHDVIVTSYDYLRRDIEAYQAYQFHFIVLDEAQYIKNHTTKNANVVKALHGTHRFALTGTPIENSLAELWSIFDFLMPGYLYHYHYFRKTFEREIVRYQNEEASKKLKRLVEPFILRRLKKEVLAELPDKIEQVQYLEFSEEEEKLYLANLVQINQELQTKLQMETLDKFQLLAMMTKLRQLCCDPRLLYDNVSVISSKLEGCMELLRNARTSGKKVLLFSSFTSLLDLIEQELVKEKFRYLLLTGETDKTHRRQYVQQFQEEDYDVFLISLKAGGTGLNLTAAEVVIHFDPWWNMSAQNQATDRAYRIGQTKNVQVYKLIMKHTIEEKIVKLQEKKMSLSDAFTSGSEGSITSMQQDEILSLFQS